METNNPLNSNTFALPKSSSVEQEPSGSAEQGLCLPFDEAIKKLPIFLQPGNEQEQKDLAMFLSQVDELHKPIAGKLSARFVFNFLEKMFKPATPTTMGPSEVVIPKQLQELTENIAFEVANSVISDFDLHDTTISVLRVLQEVSWETKTALMLTTFVFTFGDNGLSLCEESKVSINEIQMFAMFKDGFQHQLEGSDNLFTVVFKLIGSIVEFENLPASYMTSKDLKFKVARTHLIIVTYWIIRIIIAAATSHIIKLSRSGNEFDKAMSTLWDLPSQWSTKLANLSDNGHLKTALLHLQDLLKEEVDVEAYNEIKEIVEQENHEDNMKVLNALIQSASNDAPVLYDGHNKLKVHLEVLRGRNVLLLISDLNITGEELSLIEITHSGSNVHQYAEIVWIPIGEHSGQWEDAMQAEFEKRQAAMPWFSVDYTLMIRSAVIKFIREDWHFSGKPIFVLLDLQGRVLHTNAFHMMWIWQSFAFPFTRAREEALWEQETWRLELLVNTMDPKILDWIRDGKYIILYGGDDIEWIRKFTREAHTVARALQVPVEMVYLGGSLNKEDIRRATEAIIVEQLSHCWQDLTAVWYFWKRIENMICSKIQLNKVPHDHGEGDVTLQELQRLHNHDLSNRGWAILAKGSKIVIQVDGKIALLTLQEFEIWKHKAAQEGFDVGFGTHYHEIHCKEFPCNRIEFPSNMEVPSSMLCPNCSRRMKTYKSFICCCHDDGIIGPDQF